MATKVNFPYGWKDGIAIRGVPILSTYANNVYYVSSVVGSDTGKSGKTQAKPLATLTAALAKCTDSKSDIIMLMPGHAETVDAAGDIVINKIGAQIIGLGSGTLRPTFTFATDTAATITVTAANVGISNCIFTNTKDALVTGISISAAGCEIRGCTFNYTSTNDALTWITTDANCDGFVFQDNDCLGDHAGPTEFMTLIGVDRARIVGNSMVGSYSTAIVNAITTACTNLLIVNNYFANTVIDKLWIDLVASSTGRIAYNVGSVVSTAGITDANIIDAADCQLAENFASDAVGETAKLIGVVSA